MHVNSKRVSITTLGCKVNQYDTDAMLGALADAGFTLVEWGEEADVCIVNTCTVTAVADSKSRLFIHQAARRGIPVCVCGCLAERIPDQLRTMEGVGAVVQLKDRERIVEVVAGLAGAETGSGSSSLALRTGGPRTRTRGFLKIQEGCTNACSYCVIRIVRGRARTRPQSEILEDARVLASGGVRELVLSGIHISSYGADNGARLGELLRALQHVEGIERLRLGSIDPAILHSAAVDEFAGIDKLCPHFHVSLQSGCAATLRAMNRPYTPEQYAQCLVALRRVFDNPAITTDVMTGFPGETESDFVQSLEFVERMQFAKLHVFPYSERDGTAAAKMSGTVPVHERRERARRMSQLGQSLQDAFIGQFAGTTQQVLFDRTEKDGASGYTTRYVRVFAPSAKPGELHSTRLCERIKQGFMGTLSN